MTGALLLSNTNGDIWMNDFDDDLSLLRRRPAGRRTALRRLAGGLAAACASPLAVAQPAVATPAQPGQSGQPGQLAQARIVLGSGPGSAIDNLARRTAEKLQPGYAASVIVDNRTGASGQLAVGFVKTAAADGATLLLVPAPYLAIYPHTYKNLPYQPEADFAPVSLGATLDLAFAVGPMVPQQVTTLRQFVAWCRANPAKANFGSPAAGSTPHFAGAMMAQAEGLQLQHVPYRGPTPAILDMVGGQIAAACSPLGDVLSFANTGKCRLLATTGEKRSRFAPAVPTFVEQGYKEILISDWFGFFVPARTPPAQVARASEAVRAALASPDLQLAMEQSSMEVQTSTPAALAERLKADTARWGPIVRSLGFTAES